MTKPLLWLAAVALLSLAGLFAWTYQYRWHPTYTVIKKVVGGGYQDHTVWQARRSDGAVMWGESFPDQHQGKGPHLRYIYLPDGQFCVVMDSRYAKYCSIPSMTMTFKVVEAMSNRLRIECLAKNSDLQLLGESQVHGLQMLKVTKESELFHIWPHGGCSILEGTFPGDIMSGTPAGRYVVESVDYAEPCCGLFDIPSSYKTDESLYKRPFDIPSSAITRDIGHLMNALSPVSPRANTPFTSSWIERQVDKETSRVLTTKPSGNGGQ